jgi:hypothetical protein
MCEVLAIGGDVPMHYPTHSTAAPIAIMGAHMTEVSCMGYAHRGDEFWRTDSRTGNLFSNEIAQFRMSNGAVARITEGHHHDPLRLARALIAQARRARPAAR